MRKKARTHQDKQLEICGICGCFKFAKLPYCNQCGYGKAFFDVTHPDKNTTEGT